MFSEFISFLIPCTMNIKQKLFRKAMKIPSYKAWVESSKVLWIETRGAQVLGEGADLLWIKSRECYVRMNIGNWSKSLSATVFDHFLYICKS
jgi:hypothetical protein